MPIQKAHELSMVFSTAVKHRPVKRFFDIIFSALILILGMPAFLLLAIAIKLTSIGPVFYSQERVGRGGKLFRCYKFRTMIPNAEACQRELVSSNPQLHDEWLLNRKLKNDPRVTLLGTFLRKTSLDELPQFWNVLKGDLSVVGPRPVVIDEVIEHFGQKAEKILSVRPGITGLWQVSGRSNVTYPKRLLLDEQYIDDFSMFLDLK
ncbi:MAG: sugar transferase, partial [Parachlamydiaceae bacterium]|nr:sugar transferase [Parachlamydiaceae bacterium]